MTDAEQFICGDMSNGESVVPTYLSRDLEHKLAVAREALEWAQSQLGKHTRPSPIDKALASINGEGTT